MALQTNRHSRIPQRPHLRPPRRRTRNLFPRRMAFESGERPPRPAQLRFAYHFGRINYDQAHDGASLRGRVEAREGQLIYEGNVRGEKFETCDCESTTEFLLERYTAFTCRANRDRFFRVWHSPWRHAESEIEVRDATLIASTGDWWQAAECIGAKYSPGAAA